MLTNGMTTMVAVIGWPEALIILGAIVLLFGATKIPQVMRGMGQGISEFKKGIREGQNEEKKTQPAPADVAPAPKDEKPQPK